MKGGGTCTGLYFTHLTIFLFLILQTGFLGLFGKQVDAIDYYAAEIERLAKEVGTIC